MMLPYVCLSFLFIWSGLCRVKETIRGRTLDLRQRDESFGGLLLPNASSTLNKTNPQGLLAPSNHHAVCLDPKTGSRRMPTSIKECRPILNEMKNLPFFRVEQVFVIYENSKYSRPQEPHPPPYNFKRPGVNCFIELLSLGKGIQDEFSFENAKDLAISILEDCEDKGLGGINEIGINQNWLVSVSAVLPAQGNNITEEK